MRRLLALTILLLRLTEGNGQTCQAARFGPGCQYDCNCAGRCDSQTGCVGNCARGWDGPTCQRRNVALDQPTSQSSIYQSRYTSGLAVDGKVGHTLETTPCTHTRDGNQSWWTVTLDKAYSIYRFQIYNRVGNCMNVACGSRLNRFTLSVGTNNQDYRTCYTDTTASDYGPGDIIKGTCNDGNPRAGNTVRISLPAGSYTALTLCEVRLLECNRGWYGPDCATQCGFCNQGRSSCNRISGNCQLVGQVRCMAGYTGINCHRQCNGGRYGPDCAKECGFCNQGRSYCNRISGNCQRVGQVRCMAGYTGVNCHGQCNGGRYGPDCAKECGFCNQGRSYCNRISGNCQLVGQVRCMAGYTGVNCHGPCSSGWYGSDCTQACGSCNQTRSCNSTSGHCPLVSGQARCMAGYKAPDCKIQCNPGWYGPDCTEECGFCIQGRSSCERKSGDCQLVGQSRCMAGYTGINCKIKCMSYKWGPDCANNCGQCPGEVICNRVTGECPPCSQHRWGPNCEACGRCHGEAVCDGVTGECPPGNPRCATGYTGPLCTQCPDGTYGVLCNESCGECKDGNHTCDHVNGTCTSCSDGWQGEQCKEVARLTSSGNEVSIAGISGGVAGAVVLILVVVVVVLVMHRRRRGLPQKDSDAEIQPRQLVVLPQHDDPVPQDNIGHNEEAEEEDAVADEASAGFAYLGACAENTCVPAGEFRQYMLRKKASQGFKAEFETFPVGLHAKHDVADKPENKTKTRYRNLVAYDHSRVHLKHLSGQDTDYINACYVNGYNEPPKFIASQGPTNEIIDDFMRMIWEQNTGKVVMVTNLVEKTKTKCLQYWPERGSKTFGDIDVSVLDQESFSNHVIRTLQLKHNKMQKKTQIVRQFHFTAWPDHGAPPNASGILDFREKVLGYKSPLNGPIVVHCSAGIGRTGTFIALDYLINQAEEEGVVDVPACVRLLREQRVNMVQSVEQYEFLHEALAEALELQEGTIPGVDFSSVFADLCTINPETEQLKLADQFQRLNEKCCSLDKATLKTALHPDNLRKNRSPKILAGDNFRPYLSTPVAGSNNYINAVFLPTYNMKRGFIITETPLPETVVDFWRLVYDHGITTIVMLDDMENEYEDVGIYWPEKRKTFGPFDVKFTQTEEENGFSVWTYNLAYKDTKAPFPIKQFRCGFWSSEPTLASIPSLLAVIDRVTAWQKETGNQPVLVHCRDGITNSGLFCTASFVIERLKLDRDVNIPQAIKQMRVARPQIITDLDQFTFLHQVALSYLETFHTYANFK